MPKSKTRSRVGRGARGSGRPLTGGLFVTADPVTAYGVVVDGASYPLDGQPPVATSKGWGTVPGVQPGRY